MRFLLLLFFITAIPNTYGLPAVAQDSLSQEVNYDTAPAPTPLSFNDEKIASYKKDPAFDYLEEETPLSWWTKFKRYISLQYHNFLEWLFGDYSANGFLLFLVQSIPYLIIGAVLFLGVWLFNKMNPAAVFLADPKPGKVFLSEEEEIIKSHDISQMIKAALDEKDYRLAIRYNYLLVLRQLTEKEIISYEVSKTDEEYVGEIKQNLLKSHFKRLTRIYDHIWYGNFLATEKHYISSEKEFRGMQELIEQVA